MPLRVRRTARPAAIWLATLLPLPLHAQATRAPLVTDRPDQTESTAVVPVGSVQVEAGTSYAQVHGGHPHLRALTAASALARVGVLPTLEARLGFAGWQRTELADGGVRDLTASGAGDLEVQVKVRLSEGGGTRPSIALLPGVTLPTGEDDFGGSRAEPSLRLAVAHELGERLSLGWNAAVERVTETTAAGDDARADLLYTVALGIGLSERVGAFVESFGVIAAQDGLPPAHSLDGGFTFLLTPLLQLDLAGGFGISDAAEDWFFGAGISVRAPR